MNLYPILLACMSTVVKGWRWCDYGVSGNGDCELNGHHTYCCGPPGPNFPVWRDTNVETVGPNAIPECHNNGLRFCAP
ncbi:Ecp9-2 [Fulvia fulva]|uniref:Ecp9-2 n=1 Tax=Passalora fulva TaxID=5499 RepID=A0A1P8YY50_PASFU|nr:Ecp9-2 [Fulvia fulva]AQA29285.1 extracellular protein 9-2 [Fulvia fulva]KAK4621313.1 Ecp9-2 [Fulvia fulva]KAK4623478.1 Ecp9-2 [Fulvia fulva]UJO18609.1 Ecp9-2 [Fulvia fulva]WPV16054.1 Ecp9-2 [Fulvia fulva]